MRGRMVMSVTKLDRPDDLSGGQLEASEAVSGQSASRVTVHAVLTTYDAAIVDAATAVRHTFTRNFQLAEHPSKASGSLSGER